MGNGGVESALQLEVDMGICVKINKAVTLAVMILAGLWFILIVVVPQPGQVDVSGEGSGWKVESIVHPLGQGGNQELSAALEGLQLVEVINHGVPNIFGSEGILLITSEWSQIDYSYLLYSLSALKLLGERYRFPVYVLRQKSNRNLYNHRTILHQGRTLHALIGRCLEQHNIKRLSVIAYEEAALLSLLALSQADSGFIFRIDKLILINPFNPNHQLYQNEPRALSRTIKRHILSDHLRLVAFHYLRIIILNTFRTVHQEEPQSRDHFNFVFNDQQGAKFQLNSTLSLSSKALFDVVSYLPRGSYFTHKPFVSLLMRLIIDDQKAKLSLQSIEYILRYREGTEGQAGRLPSGACRVLFLEELQRSRTEVRDNCYRIVQRQRHKFRDAVLLLSSHERIELYANDLTRIPTTNYKSSSAYASVVSSLAEVDEMVLLAGERPVQILLTTIRSPLRNPFPVLGAEEGVRVSGQAVVMESCEGWRAVIGAGLNQHLKELIEWRAGDCYIELQDYSFYAEWFTYHWTAIRNVIIFTLFSSHVLGRYSYRRYYTSLAVNLFLLLFLLKKIYLFENMVITSTAALLEMAAMSLLKVTQWLHISRQYYIIVVLLPLGVELFSRVNVGLFLAGTSGKLLCMQVLFVNEETGYLITLIKSYFMISVYATQQPCIYSLALLAAWQATRLPGSPLRSTTPLAKAKNRLIDVLFLGMLCFSLEEEGSVIHQLINFYMITHLLMGAGEAANRLMDPE